MKKLIVAFPLLLAAPAVYAGLRSTAPVSISITGRNATGVPGSARGSADTRQLIGCQTYNTQGGSAYGTCAAINATGTQVSCWFVDDDSLAHVAQSQEGDSYLSFNWDLSGKCTVITVWNSSQWAPKVP
jgi:hypothetical protein